MIAQAVLLVLAGLLGGVGLVLLVPIVNSVADTTDTIHVPVDRQLRRRIGPARGRCCSLFVGSSPSRRW